MFFKEMNIYCKCNVYFINAQILFSFHFLFKNNDTKVVLPISDGIVKSFKTLSEDEPCWKLAT